MANEQLITNEFHGLTLVPVGYTILLQFFDKIGGIENFAGQDAGEVIEKMQRDKQVMAAKATNGLINYVAGYGVENEPDEDGLRILEFIGQRTGVQTIDRAMWVRAVVLGGNDNLAMELMTRVMSLSKKEK